MTSNYYEQLAQDGYLLLKDYLTVEESEQIVDWANQIENYKEEKGKWMIYFESNGERSRIENFLDYHQNLNAFIEEKITPLLENICRDKMNIFKDKMNWKRAFGAGFKAHQDHPAWTDFPPSKFYSVALFANRTTVENGCLEFVKGKNKDGLLDYNSEGNGQIKEKIEKELNWEYVTTSPRDILIFDSFAPHRSDKNNTQESRRIFYFTYNYAKEGSFYYKYLRRKRVEFPPNIERDSEIKYEGTKYNLANPIR